MLRVESFVCDEWRHGTEVAHRLLDATTSEPVAELAPIAVDGAAVLGHARDMGSRELRKLTFHERAAMLKSLAKYLGERKQALYDISTLTGATRMDSALDVEGGLGVLFSYASRAQRELPDGRVYLEGPAESASKSGEFVGRHICVPRPGACVQINAYNFPVWGMLEKLAPALLAGSAVVVKPATATCYVTELLVRQIIESGLLPAGAIQLICGGLGGLFSHLSLQDSVAFTGSAATARKLRQDPAFIERGTRFSAETDSLNACLMGPDVAPGAAEFDLLVKEVVNEMTLKAGQRCTAIRRVIVDRRHLDDACEALRTAFGRIVVGDPRRSEVSMGPLVGQEQRGDVLANVARLREETELLTPEGGGQILSDHPAKGAFVAPTLLLCRAPRDATLVHSTEAFGPVCTIMPYEGVEDAVYLANKGGGSLVCSLFTADADHARAMTAELAPYHGRILIANEAIAKQSTGHGSPLPGLIHGGPGRAGGGEELGGLRAVLHNMQRTAIQGAPGVVDGVGEA